MSQCTLCKTEMPDRQAETGSEIVHAGATAGTSLGDFEICEPCYRQGLPVFFTQADLAEIHLRFGLEYCELARWSDSVEALSRAMQINESADILVALGFAEEKQGNRESALSHYQRALEIEPAHSAARESLQKLDSQAA